MIAGGRGDDTAQVRIGAPRLVEIDEPSADLEGADRGVVLVLDPQIGPDPPRQLRPTILGRWRHHFVHECRRHLQYLEGNHRQYPRSGSTRFSSGRPASKRRMLSRITGAAVGGLVSAATCGVTTMRGWRQNGCSAGSGSCRKTSSTAAESWPLESAGIRSSSTR